jgi:glycosyltransferase involved in cell wall biosynthesis
MTRPTILILIGAFWPGHDSSGPNLSIKAQCEALANAFGFRIVARDGPFGGAALDDGRGWRDLGWAQARYLPVGRLGAQGLAALLRDTPHDLLVLNGFFDREFTIPALIARRFGRGSRAPVLLSPRGEFTGGALSLKGGRKAGYLRLVKALGLIEKVHIHATSDAEMLDIRAALPDQRVTLVPNFRPLFDTPPHTPRASGAPLRLAFLGRISPVKGLDTALRAIAAASAPVHLDIYGPIADAAHWTDCQSLMATLPPHVSATHQGEISNADAPAMLAAHDALLLPSLSENFGHAIFESLAAGTPVVIGNQTPWRGLEAAKAGYDLPVGDVTAFAMAINSLAQLSPAAATQWRSGAVARARHHADTSTAKADMAALFTRLIESRA